MSDRCYGCSQENCDRQVNCSCWCHGKTDDWSAAVAELGRKAKIELPSASLTEEAACELLCGIEPYHHDDCPIAASLRDCWTTPRWLTDLLPKVTLDPCSNARSTVRASRHIVLPSEDVYRNNFDGKTGSWEQGDGLVVSWKNRSVFVNPPYSRIMPWARKAGEARAFIFLVNNVTTTKWYRELLANGGSYKFEFDKRLKFSPPPRIQESSNNRDQVLICNREGWQMIGDSLKDHGRWWIEHSGYLPR